MPSNFNPFSGLGKIESYIRWNRLRNFTFTQVANKSINKFGIRWKGVIDEKISEIRLKENSAKAFRQSGLNRDIAEIRLPSGQNRSNIIRVTARVQNSKFRTFGTSISSNREVTMDLPRKGTKRQLQRTLREKILDAFFEHYDIANKYRADFRRRFGEIDIVELEGV